eukprot:92927-Amphidinium_carterae.1
MNGQRTAGFVFLWVVAYLENIAAATPTKKQKQTALTLAYCENARMLCAHSPCITSHVGHVARSLHARTGGVLVPTQFRRRNVASKVPFPKELRQ